MVEHLAVWGFVFLICQVLGAWGQSFLVVADSQRDGVFWMNVAGGNHVKISVPLLDDPVATGFDPVENSVYVTGRDTSSNRERYISKVGLNGAQSFARHPLPRVSVLDGLAVDPISRLVYYTDAGEDHIGVMSIDLTLHSIILRDNLDRPRGIALDPLNGTMYWTDFGRRPYIGKANMDGTEPSLVVASGVIWPFGLTIDVKGNQLFWCDAKTFKIESANTDGSNRRTIVFRPLERFFGLAFDETYVYWTAWNQRAIQRARRDRTGFPSELGEVFPVNTTRMHGLTLVNPSLTVTGTNACSGSNRGGCEQLCLPRKSSRICACSDLFFLNPDGRTCERLHFRHGLLLTDEGRKGVFVMDLDTEDTIRVPIRGGSQLQGIVLDPVTSNIIWTDAVLRVVVRATVDGSVLAILKRFGDTAQPRGIAFDPVARIWYVVDSGRDVISSIAIKANGTQETILIETGLDEPRALALDLTKRMMYWTDWGFLPKIERSALNGTSRSVLVNTDIGWPNGLVVDAKAGRLYWTDGLRHRIESSDLEGMDRRILLSDSSSNFLGLTKGPFDLFFSIRNNRTIYKLNLGDRRVSAVGKAQFQSIYDLEYFPIDITTLPVTPRPTEFPSPTPPITDGERTGTIFEVPQTPTGVPGTPTGRPPPPTGVPGTPRGRPPPSTGVPGTPRGRPPPPTGVPGTPTGRPPPPTGVPGTPRGRPPPPTGVPGTPTGRPPPRTGVPPIQSEEPTTPQPDTAGISPPTDTIPIDTAGISPPTDNKIPIDTAGISPPADTPPTDSLSDNHTLIIVVSVGITGLVLVTVTIVVGIVRCKTRPAPWK